MSKRKYKHKVTGREVTYDSTYKMYTMPKTDCVFASYIPVDIIEDSSDWEQVVVKNHQIVSLKGLITGSIYTWDGEKFSHCKNGSTTIQKMNTSVGMYEIHSVRRLCDGVVFTIGDRLEWMSEPISRIGDYDGIGADEIWLDTAKGSGVVISGATKECKVAISETEWKEFKAWKACKPLNPADYCHEAKKVLMTTEDGIKVYEGKPPVLHRLCINDWTTDRLEPCTECISYDTYNYKYWVSRHTMKEYIEYAKPVLSMKDLVDRDLNDDCHKEIALDVKDLKETIRAKISLG